MRKNLEALRIAFDLIRPFTKLESTIESAIKTNNE